MLKPWRVLKSSTPVNDEWLIVRSDTCRTAAGKTIEPYYVLEYPHWVNVIALTPDAQIVLVRQYRHGAGKIMLEIPCGVMHELDSSPALAVARELAEETGYGGDPPLLIGSFYANPANQNNKVSSFLVINARQSGKRQLDPNEEIEVVLLDLADFLESVFSGRIKLQGLHNSALLLALPYLLQRLSGADRQRLRKFFG